jgi:PAS domain S-box-containing protein
MEHAAPKLSEFLVAHQETIIAEWTQRMRSLAPARDLSVMAIVDHLPQILSRIADVVRSDQPPGDSSLGRLPEDHAVDRLERGFDLDQMVTEYGLLRGSILDLWETRVGATVDLRELRALDRAFDEALRRATVRHAQTRQRLLKALDGISVAALGSTDLDTFLQHLLRATLESTESVDTAVVLLREAESLRVRAAVGLEQDLQQLVSIPDREGIAGQVAAEGQPIFIRDAAADGRVNSRVFREKGVRALYTVPLVHEGSVIGVAHIGSLSAFEFSEEDKLLFRTMTSRATSVIVQAQLLTELRRSEETFRLALEAAPTAILIVGREGRITLANSLTERLLGYSRQELIGSSIEDLVPVRYRHGHGKYRRDFFASLSRRPMGAGRDLFALRQDGSEVPVEIGLSPFQSDGTVFVLAAITDITERKRAEDERAQLLAREQAARQEVERTNHLKDEFLATLSHELRTPLNAIVGYARMLRSGAMDQAKHPQVFEKIDRNAMALTQIVEDVLDVSRIISGKVRMRIQPVDLAALVRDTVETVRPAAEAKRLNTDIHVDSKAAPISGDSDRLQQVVWNLLSNAVKFTPDGGRIQVRVEHVDGQMEVVVSDTGMGITPEFLPHMFERFRQGDGGTSREHGGLGLGLAIARHLVELHGGSISGASAGRGKGATFRVRLPFVGVQPEPESPESRVPPPRAMEGWKASHSSLQGVHVLAVDDDADALTLLREIFESAGAQVTAIDSGAQVLRQIHSARPDVVVTDIAMPSIDGYEMLRRIRSSDDKAVSHVPAIALTAHARSEDRAKASASGFQLHIAKPIDPSELIAAVAALVRRPAND